jgi:hypothetical protein
MSTAQAPERINEAPVRGVATLVSAAVAAALALAALLSAPWIAGAVAAALCADFIVRAAGRSALSPLAGLSRSLQGSVFRYRSRMITAQPKRFAAGIGAFITALAAASWLMGWDAALYGSLAVLLLFSFLEAAFRFCAGCKMFALLVRLGLLREDVCYDCVFPGGEGI